MKALRGLLVAALLTPAATVAAQQASSQQRIELARAQLDLIETQGYDSARVLLEGVLRTTAVRVERIRGYTLMAFAQLGLKNRLAARQSFEQAIRLDPTLRIDSLDLDASAPEVFALARSIVGTAPVNAPVVETKESKIVLLLTVIVPQDTTLSATDARLPFIVQPNAAARVVTTITELPGGQIWADTQTTLARHRLTWPLRKADGSMWHEGRYLLRSQATDSLGQTQFEERTIRLARAPVDTQMHPAALPASAFLPEAMPALAHTTPRFLVGAGLAALAFMTPTLLGSPDLNAELSSDPTSYAVAGGVAVASVIGFVRGKRPQKLPANIQKNKDLRARDKLARSEIIDANSDARAKAPIRVTAEKAP